MTLPCRSQPSIPNATDCNDSCVLVTSYYPPSLTCENNKGARPEIEVLSRKEVCPADRETDGSSPIPSLLAAALLPLSLFSPTPFFLTMTWEHWPRSGSLNLKIHTILRQKLCHTSPPTRPHHIKNNFIC